MAVYMGVSYDSVKTCINNLLVFLISTFLINMCFHAKPLQKADPNNEYQSTAKHKHFGSTSNSAILSPLSKAEIYIEH